jgi:hypothetical protein
LTTGQVRVYDLIRMISRDGRPTGLGEAFVHYGRIFKTLHLLCSRRPQRVELQREILLTRRDTRVAEKPHHAIVPKPSDDLAPETRITDTGFGRRFDARAGIPARSPTNDRIRDVGLPDRVAR